MTKPENKYKRGSVVWSVMEGDWEDLTVPEIAEVLNTSPKTVLRAIHRIKKETGYEVQRSRSTKLEGLEKMAGSETFPARLRRLRERNGLSGLILGELCGLSKNMILYYEKEWRSPRLDSLLALADYFNVSIDYLVGRTDNPQRIL